MSIRQSIVALAESHLDCIVWNEQMYKDLGLFNDSKDEAEDTFAFIKDRNITEQFKLQLLKNIACVDIELLRYSIGNCSFEQMFTAVQDKLPKEVVKNILYLMNYKFTTKQ